MYPDFTIIHPATKKTYYYEHFGMMDNPEYAHSAYRKLELYSEHGIIPSINLITTFETQKHPLDYERKALKGYAKMEITQCCKICTQSI